MNRWILPAVITLLLPGVAAGGTKHLECKQTTDKGVEQMIYATIDDSSDKAEVELFALSVLCAKNRSCGTDIYAKVVLPSVIRLTKLTAGGSSTYTKVIDIDRTTLSVVTRTELKTSNEVSGNTAYGKCSVSVDRSEKLL